MHPEEGHTAPAPKAKQTEIYFRPERYSAFPHIVALTDKELLLSFREAPRAETVQHTHPRSIISIVRSYDGGMSWDIRNASQMGAGGGQELSLISFGRGHVGGALAWHEVVPVNEKDRSGVPHAYAHEYPFRTPGAFWCWSETYGLTWPPHQVVFFGAGTMPCGPPHLAQDGTLLCPVYSLTPSGMSSVLYRSRDNGRSWSEPVVMVQGIPGTREFCEPCIVETAPGILLALHRVETAPDGAGCFWLNRSEDSGTTWSTPQNTRILSGACPRLLRLADGRLLLTFGRRWPPYGIRAMLSQDGGATWGDTAWILRSTHNGNQGYTSTVELGNNRVLTVSYAENDEGTTGIVGTFWDIPARTS